MSLSCRQLLPLLALSSSALAGVQELWWNVTYVQDANPDGLFERRVIGVNGTWPPPPIEVSTTDSLLVHVTNSIDQLTTLHHHGMYFNATSWMDGAMGVSQCGIPPGDTFDYVVPINSSGQVGTYWAHGHANGIYVDGLRTPLLLHSPNETYGADYDAEFTILLSDWYHEEQPVLSAAFINIANPAGAEPIPDSALIYFSQNGSYLPPIPGSNPSPVTSAVGFNENATLPFEPGKTYRLRIINFGAFAGFYFWIDGHEMQIIEADGTDTQEQSVDMLSVSVAQRYSVLVTARNDTTSSNWAIHANMDTTMFDTVPSNLNPNLTSSITYSTSANLTNLSPVSSYITTNDSALVPIDIVPALSPTNTLQLAFNFETMDDGTNHAFINDVVYNSPVVPAIMSALSLGENATSLEAYGPYSFVINYGDVIDLVVQNGDTGKHPFHLHGYKVQIVNRATQYNSTDPSLNPPLIEGQANPMRRDTVTITGGGSVTLRFVANNPGAWIFHCHIEWHLESGLAVQLITAPLQIQEQALGRVPAFMYEQCSALGVPSSGNAAGHASPTDLSGLPLGPAFQVLGWLPKGIGAMAGCVLTAIIGILTVVWYSAMGGTISEEEIEELVRQRIEEKERKGKFFGLFKKKT
ncbi:Fet3 ferroxidase [Suillus subalutaceus]|uniref:Fet3 ferroxidase n=1 Tax=Suillus subalutaceus TaxID=48586 RepID=UPI001B8829ED|nr:Fet3 ferroxidase [Suillus subalutaceus]KAG1862535.1 Fet3 ferroxidase [Suillus subalutaceus]